MVLDPAETGPHPRRPGLLALLLAGAVVGPGCAVVPRSRLDDARKVAQGLRAENLQLKDAALSLKGENTDLTQRAVDDARKIAALEDARSQLEESVQGYIDEREELVDSFRRFKRLAQAAASPPSTAMLGRLKAFASAHEGTTFDPETGVLSVEADRLFLPGTDRLRPAASRWLADCAEVLAEPEAKARPLNIAGHSSDSPVRPAGTASATVSDLSLPRALRLRDVLADRLGRDPARIGVSGFGTSRPLVTTPDDRARARNARIEIDISTPVERL